MPDLTTLVGECENAYEATVKLRELVRDRAQENRKSSRLFQSNMVKKATGLSTTGCGAELITQADMISGGYVISLTLPGVYKFAEDLFGEFVIDGDNIKVDLCCHKLEPFDASPGTIGFQLIPGHKNITITNGTICKFQGAAVDSFITVASGLTLDELNFADLDIVDNGDGTLNNGALYSTGINLDGDFDFSPLTPSSTYYFFNVLIKNCKINRNTQRGVNIAAGDGITVNSSTINDTYLLESGSQVQGVQLVISNNIQIFKS